MTDLFPPNQPAAPLAERLRPKHIDEVIGQSHLLGAGKPLRLAFQSGKLHSMILWGPPGVGKTTLARLMAQAFDAEFTALSAVFSGVKDIRDAVARAQATLSAFLIAFAVSQLFYGPLSDRFGRRPMLLGGTAVYVLGSIACALAQTMEALIAARFVQGFGCCAATVISWMPRLTVG